METIVAWAYDLNLYQIEGPAWLKTERYEIGARTGSASNENQMRSLLRSELSRRFKLVAHRTTKAMPLYEMVPDKKGIRLQRSNADAGRLALGQNGMFSLIGRGITVAKLAQILSLDLEQPVIDKTSLEGAFDFNLDFAPYFPVDKSGHPTGVGTDLPPIIVTAVREQLGLRLEAKRGLVDVLVVDSAEKTPAEN